MKDWKKWLLALAGVFGFFVLMSIIDILADFAARNNPTLIMVPLVFLLLLLGAMCMD